MILRACAVIATIWMVAACSVASPPRMVSHKAAPLPITMRFAVSAEDRPSADLQRFTAALQQKLIERGVQFSDSSAFVLTPTLSRRAASLGVTSSNNPAETQWLSPPRKHQLLDQCRAQRIQLSVMGKGETNTQIAFLGRGELDFCTLEDADIAALADQFAAAITAQ